MKTESTRIISAHGRNGSAIFIFTAVELDRLTAEAAIASLDLTLQPFDASTGIFRA
jgi:hypothetical protein